MTMKNNTNDDCRPWSPWRIAPLASRQRALTSTRWMELVVTGAGSANHGDDHDHSGGGNSGPFLHFVHHPLPIFLTILTIFIPPPSSSPSTPVAMEAWRVWRQVRWIRWLSRQSVNSWMSSTSCLLRWSWWWRWRINGIKCLPGWRWYRVSWSESRNRSGGLWGYGQVGEKIWTGGA